MAPTRVRVSHFVLALLLLVPFRIKPVQINWTYVRVPPGAVEGEQLHVRTPEDLTQEVRARRGREKGGNSSGLGEG